MICRNRELTICEVLFGIPIHDEGIKSINFIILMGKWFIKQRRTQDKVLNFHTFRTVLKAKIDMIIYNKTINNKDPDKWEMCLAIML